MSRAAIGIDVGGTAIKAVVCDADGQVLARLQHPTPPQALGLTEVLAGVVAQLSGESGGIADDEVVGLCVPGIIDESRGVAVLAVNLGWRDEPLAAQLADRLGRPALLGHDVRAGGLAELTWGAGRGQESLMFLALGTGIATALLLDGRAVVGGGYAGETGHVRVVDPHDGQRRVLEQICSAAAIGRRWAERSRPDVPPLPGSEEVFAAAAAGDAVAAEVVDEAISTLADALAGQLSLLGPVPLVVGGGLSRAGERLLGPLREALADRLPITGAPRVSAAELGSWAGAMGSAALALGAAAEEGAAAVAHPRVRRAP